MLQFQLVITILALTLRSNFYTADGKSITNNEVNGEVFKKALVWMEKNCGKPIVEEDELKPKEPVNLDHLDDWEKKYMDMPVSEMCLLVTAANFLEIKGLVKLQIQGKSVEEIRATFNDEVTGEVFKKSLVWMEKNCGKPIVEEDELKPKEPVNWDHLDDWEKKYMDFVNEKFVQKYDCFPTPIQCIGKLNKLV